ncbi:macrodomain Ter protein MatP [Candidatus Profftia tarda]|nr:macrodomain Ter protein MatP [Candidatus Profftia tarda]
MKYQKNKDIEDEWKWKYLVRKYHEGQSITRYMENDLSQQAVILLFNIENKHEHVQDWIRNHMNPDLEKKIKQSIRAKRKRKSNAESINERKKSIDLEYLVWQHLSKLAKSLRSTLSDTIMHLLEDAEEKEKYEKKILSLKKDLQSFILNNNQ